MEYCNGAVPPFALIMIDPLLVPLHVGLAGVAELITTAVGVTIVAVVVFEQPLESLTTIW